MLSESSRVREGRNGLNVIDMWGAASSAAKNVIFGGQNARFVFKYIFRVRNSKLMYAVLRVFDEMLPTDILKSLTRVMNLS